MRFLVDENLPIDVAEVLAAAGHDAEHVSEIGLRGASDSEVWKYGANEQRIVVTRDLDFPLREAPRPPGLILLRMPDFYTRAQLRQGVAEFCTTEQFSEVEGKITVLSPGRIRTRTFE
ncbi:MAG: DUF5615 family PIN-like protein [Dehalococcoidia bacterium]